MVYAYHIFTILFIIYEFHWLITIKDRVRSNKRFEELKAEFKGKEVHEYSKEYSDLILTKGCSPFIILFWLLIGLFTQQWIVFATYLVFQFIVIVPLSAISRFSRTYTIIHWINSLIGLLFGLFVLYNEFRLHIYSDEIIEMFLN